MKKIESPEKFEEESLSALEMQNLGVKEEDNAYVLDGPDGRRYFFMKILGKARLKKDILEKKKELGL